MWTSHEKNDLFWNVRISQMFVKLPTANNYNTTTIDSSFRFDDGFAYGNWTFSGVWFFESNLNSRETIKKKMFSLK